MALEFCGQQGVARVRPPAGGIIWNMHEWQFG
jgi:hypothetical protein